MLLSLLLLFIGLVVLYFGAEYLVKGASSVALSVGMTPLLVGLTVVAFGTSMPELVVSLLAATAGNEGIAIGNVIGSNIANIALIVGISALILPMAVDRDLVRRDYWWMLAFAVGLWALGYFDSGPRQISRLDALALFLPFLAYIGYCVYTAVKHRRETRVAYEAMEKLPDEIKDIADDPVPLWKSGVFVVVGVLGLVVGARLMVDNAVTIARVYGLSDTVIGVTIVALGTSLPELATSVVAALRRETDIALGNIVGSNIFNTGLVLGTVGLIHPMDIEPAAWNFDVLVMIGVTVLLFVVMIFTRRITRLGGGLLLATYIAYIVMTFLRATQEPAIEAVATLSGTLGL